MKLLSDYSFIKGVNHDKWLFKTPEQTEFEISCAQRLGVNSMRVWVTEKLWVEKKDEYLNDILSFVRLCNSYGISVMPIFWNGNTIRDFKEPTEEEWEVSEAYAKAIVDLLKDEPNIIMWDVMNEPYCNDYIRKCPDPDEKARRMKQLEALVRRMTSIIRKLDPNGVITIGHEFISHCPSTNDIVDVISFHDYLTTRKDIEAIYTEAERQSEETGKPIINTETGCVGRINPYDVELEICQRHKVGWYLFCLVVEDFWGDIHGVIYPDGTVRDPSIVAAMLGFFRNRDVHSQPYYANKEGFGFTAVEAVREALDTHQVALFHAKKKTTDDILEAAEKCANLLEAAQLVSMDNPPSAKLLYFRSLPEEKRNLQEIRKFAYELAELVKEKCHIV